MAMFLSRIKQILNLGTKSITANGTYNASTDGYDGYSSVEVNVPQITPASITPSNSSPAAMTANTPVNPTANGYAIASYNTKTPSNSSPAVLESGEIDKIGGNGYAIQHYDMVTPSSTPTSVSAYDVVMIGGSGVIVDSIPVPPSVTPSNASPAALTSGSAVTPSANGYAIASYEEIDVPSAVYTHNIYPDMPTISRVGAMIGVEQMHFHSLDASNSDPDTITDGEIYRADGSGKAVASITDVMPSSTPTSVSMDDVVHIYGSGVIVDSIPTPTNLTPSNSSPATITSGETYTATANGKAVSSVTDITPSNSSPVSLSSGSIYKPSASGKAISSLSDVAPSNANPPNVHTGDICKITTRDGYLISTINIVEPSDSNPPLLSNNNSWYRLNGASGYLYSTIQKFKQGSVTLSTSSQTSVTLGFKPKYLCVYSTNSYYSNIYDENISTTSYIRATSSGPLLKAFDSNYNGGLVSINSNGFTCRTCTTSVGLTWKYIAIG